MKNKRSLFVKLAAGVLVSCFGTVSAFAGVLSGISDTLSSDKASSSSNHSFIFTTPTGVASGTTIILSFPSEFVIPAGLTFADVDVNDNGPYIGSTTLAATNNLSTAGLARTSTTTLTYTNGNVAITAGHTIYIRIGTNAIFQSTGSFQIVNATTTGNKSIGITGTFGDTGTSTVNIIGNDTVQISATVLQTLTFSISSTSINFGNLSSASAKFASSTNAAGDTIDTVAHTLAVSTNAPSGYSITVLGQTLTSQQVSSNTISAIGASPAVSSTGSEQFGIYATKTGGVNGTIASPYATPSSFGYNATATTSATFASGTTPTNTETYSLHYLANIATITEAGTYSANLVYVGTANF